MSYLKDLAVVFSTAHWGLTGNVRQYNRCTLRSKQSKQLLNRPLLRIYATLHCKHYVSKQKNVIKKVIVLYVN